MKGLSIKEPYASLIVDFELVGRALLDRWGLEPENWTAPAPAPDIELDLFWAEFGEKE